MGLERIELASLVLQVPWHLSVFNTQPTRPLISKSPDGIVAVASGAAVCRDWGSGDFGRCVVQLMRASL